MYLIALILLALFRYRGRQTRVGWGKQAMASLDERATVE